MKNQTIVFRVDQGDYHPVFSLRQITVKDDSEYLQSTLNTEDGDRYQPNVEALAKWATEYPKDKPECEDALDTEEKVRAFFAEADVDKDWIAEQAVWSLRQRHQPQVSFF